MPRVMHTFGLVVAAIGWTAATGCTAPTPPRDDAGAAMDAGRDAGRSDPDAGRDAGAPAPRRVLFVGNSYTFFHELPDVVAAVAATPLEVESVTMGGATLGTHWATTGARERIEAGGLDAVVMQGQSLEAAFGAGDFLSVAELFAAAIDEAGADGVWFATWARRADDPMFTPSRGPAEMAQRIQDNYTRAARFGDDVVARVGAAWELARLELPAVALHASDGSHPAPEGTLLAACVIAHAITGAAPALPDPAPLGVDPDVARALCDLAPRVHCAGPGCCLSTEGDCDGACVDLQLDPQHCGACGTRCADEDPCRLGECGCPAGFTGCDRQCADLASSPAHCGACGVRCEGGAVCAAGACACQRATVQPVSYAELSVLEPGCSLFTPPETSTCAAAAHRHCAAQACFDGGYGPPTGHSPVVEEVTCVEGDARATTYTALAAHQATCDGVTERRGLACAAAIHAECVAAGAVSGFGPVTDAGDDLTITCVASATVVTTTLADLTAHASRCAPDPVTCTVAAWGLCVARGHAGGFGPIHVAGADAEVVCFDP